MCGTDFTTTLMMKPKITACLPQAVTGWAAGRDLCDQSVIGTGNVVRDDERPA
jgi:hypothetical protein